MKPLDGSGLNKRKIGLIPKQQDEEAINAKRTAENSMRKRDGEIDMTGMDVDFLPPPPPPPFPMQKVTVNPVVPAIVSTSRRPVKSVNSNSLRVFTVAELQQYTNSFSQENFIGAGTLGSVFRAELPDGKV